MVIGECLLVCLKKRQAWRQQGSVHVFSVEAGLYALQLPPAWATMHKNNKTTNINESTVGCASKLSFGYVF